MARNHIAIYVWIVDTIERFGHITLSQLNRQWELSPYSDGNPLARRTFFNYRNAIEEIFNINILCNRSTFEYYIDHTESESESRLQHWLLDSMSLSEVLLLSKCNSKCKYCSLDSLTRQLISENEEISKLV